MKRFFVAALLAAVCVGSSINPAHAIGVFGTWWQADDADDDALGVGVRMKKQLIPLVAMDARASWLNFGGETDINLFPIEATGMLKLGMLYAGLGVGYYIFDSTPSVDNKFGWYVVGGIDIGLGGFGVFGEGKWTSLSTEAEDVDIGDFEAGGWSVNLGVMFGVPAI